MKTLLRFFLLLCLCQCQNPSGKTAVNQERGVPKHTEAPKPARQTCDPPMGRECTIGKLDIQFAKVYCGEGVFAQDSDGKVYEIVHLTDYRSNDQVALRERKDLQGLRELFFTKNRLCYLNRERRLFCIDQGKHIQIDEHEVIDMAYDSTEYLYYIDHLGKLNFVWIKEDLPFEREDHPYKFQVNSKDTFIKVGGQCAVKSNLDLLCWRTAPVEKWKTFPNKKEIQRIWGNSDTCFETKDKKIYCMPRIYYGEARSPDCFFSDFKRVKTPPYSQYRISLNFREILLDPDGALWMGGEELFQDAKIALGDSGEAAWTPELKKWKLPFKIQNICDSDGDSSIAGITENNELICLAGLCDTGMLIDGHNQCSCVDKTRKCGCPPD